MGGMGCRHTPRRERGWSRTANARIECSAADEHTQVHTALQTNPHHIRAIYRTALHEAWERTRDRAADHPLSEVVDRPRRR